jgi:tetratricopeptide (TPR) repeat protein
MPTTARLGLALVALLGNGLPDLQAQLVEDRPAPYVPAGPPTRQEMDRREGLRQYALGLLCERDDRLLEAIRAFEKAGRLDPEAVPACKALIPLYLATDRAADALATTRKVLDLDPGDYETWFLYGRQLRGQGQLKEARTALARGLACPSLKERPELALEMHHDLGAMCESAQEYEDAAAAFLEAAKILEHPDTLLEVGPLGPGEIAARAADLYERAGRAYLQARKYDQALAAFRKAQGKAPEGGGRLNYNLARICQEQGKLTEALGYLDAYLRLQPQGTDAYDLRITLLQRLRRDAEVLPWLEQASANDRHNIGLKLLLARQLARSRQTDRAEKVYRELAEQSPTPEVYRGLFALYKDDARLGLDRALTLLNKTLESTAKKDNAAPDQPAPAQARAMIAALRDDAGLAKDLLRVALPRLDRDAGLGHETLHFLAVLADRNSQPAEAERFYRQCLRGVTPATEALVYGGLLRVLWKANKDEDILQVCRDGLVKTKATSHVLFYSDLARALARLDRMDEALAAADNAVRLAADADRLTLRLLRIRLLAQANRLPQAEAECQALLKEATQPGDALEVRYVLSSIYSIARRYAQAEEELERILKVDPNNATACNDLGYLWADQGKNLKEAEDLVRKALELDRRQKQSGPPRAGADADKDNAAYVDSLGWVLFRRGRLDAARQELERAAALPDGEDPVIWDHLGDVYYRLEMTARARETWQRALHLYEQDRRRKMDQRYKDLKHKLKLLGTQLQP